MARSFLLKTKLFVPQSRGQMVDRPRLTARLQEGLSRRLTLISAPPGFGKSSVLMAWRGTPEGSTYPLAWLSLDEADNDPVRFWTYLIAALAELRPGVGEQALGLLQGAQQVPVTAMLQLLINDLTEMESDFALVLDDYHFIETTSIHEGISFLLEYMPPQMHLVLTTRADPPLPLSRLRARNAMIEIRVKDLRFTEAEAAQFLREVQGLALAETDLEALTARTEGWVTGLQLAALSLQATEDVSGFMVSMAGNHRYIVDYLMEEVLQRQPEAIQRFLLATAVLPRLSGPLCEAVTGDSGSQAILERLESANLFTVALDAERRWFRYHQLMSTVLRSRLQQTSAAEIPHLCERASIWFEAEGLMGDAIRMAIEGRQFERAAELLTRTVDDLWRSGEIATIRAFLSGLPATLLRERADLALIRTRLALAEADFPTVAEALGDAERLPGADPGEVAAYGSVLARVQHDLPTTFEKAERALAHLPDRPVAWGPIAATSLALAHVQAGDLMAASHTMAGVERMSQAMGDDYFTVIAICIQAEVAETLGNLRLAFETYQRAERISRSRPGLMQNTGLPRIGMGRVLLEWHELTEAARHLDDGLRIALATSHMDSIYRGFGAQVPLRSAQGDLAGVEVLLRQIAEVIPANTVLQVELLSGAARTQGHLVLGRIDLAEEWGRRVEPIAVDLPVALDAVTLTLAQLEVAAGRPAQAIARLKPLLERAEGLRMVAVQVRGLIILALAQKANGDAAQAAAAIKQAVLLGRPEGFVQSFLAGGPVILSLLAQVRGVAPDYVDRLLSLAGHSAPVIRSEQPLVEPLSEREIELLGLLAAGLPNQAIAERLFIAPGTVKRHVHNILGKLEATDRQEAVAKARALGLL